MTWRASCEAVGVDCRLDVTRDATGAVVHLAGRLRHLQVPDLVETCVNAGLPLRVDLSQLISADAVGIDALIRVRDMGGVLDGLPTFLQLTIDSRTEERDRPIPPER